MAEIFDAEIIEVLQRLRSLCQFHMQFTETPTGVGRLSISELGKYTELVGRFIALAEKIPLPISIECASRFLPAIEDPPYTYERKGAWLH